MAKESDFGHSGCGIHPRVCPSQLRRLLKCGACEFDLKGFFLAGYPAYNSLPDSYNEIFYPALEEILPPVVFFL